ncbi:TPA: hypothetical protein ACGZ99_003419 [Elizabethkingia anophelis]
MEPNSFSVNLKLAVYSWYLLMISGIFTSFGGIFIILVLDSNYNYKPLEILIEIVFITAGLSGAIFSLLPSKSISDWTNYFIFSMLIFILGNLFSEYLINSFSFIIGFTALFRNVQLLNTILYLKRCKFFQLKKLTATNIAGLLLALLLIVHYIVFKNLNFVVTTGISFIIMGLSYIFQALDLKRIREKIFE